MEIPDIFLDDSIRALHTVCAGKKSYRPTLEHVHFTKNRQEATDSYLAIQVHKELDERMTGLVHRDELKKKTELYQVASNDNFPSFDMVKPKEGKTAMLNFSLITLKKLVRYMEKAKINNVDIFQHGDCEAYTLEFPSNPTVTGFLMKCKTDKVISKQIAEAQTDKTISKQIAEAQTDKNTEVKAEDLPF